MLLDGIAEFAGRRPDDGTPGRAVLHAAAVKKARAALAAGEPADPPGCDEFTADELMPVLRLSKSGAQRQVGLAVGKALVQVDPAGAMTRRKRGEKQGHHARAHRDDPLRPSRRRTRLHPQPQAPPQDPRPQPHLFLLGLPQARRPVRR